jgi:peptidoglycan lytic transglycosylase G
MGRQKPKPPRRLPLLMAAALAAFAAWQVLVPTAALREGARRIDLPANEGVLEIGRRLDGAGLIRSPLTFAALAVLRGTARHLRAGEYEIPEGSSTLHVLRLVESGKVVQHALLLPEGGSVAELAHTLEREGLASAPDVVRLAHDPRFLRAMAIEAPSIEGYLFPDTYLLVRGLTPEEILLRMVHRLRAKVTPPMLDEARQRGLDLNGLLTLASIIEREAVVRDEMPLISAVFWNRLRLDMPLQADPTVQYAVGKDRQALSRADLLADDPYNTYRRPGLPPGPIASPGLAAIEAALHPAQVKYLYFVSMDDRRHFFSSTIEEHNAAVARYRLARVR